jgi:hypothetical protein
MKRWICIFAVAGIAAVCASAAFAMRWSISWTVGTTTATGDGTWKTKPVNLYTFNGKPAIKWKFTGPGGNTRSGYVRVKDNEFTLDLSSLHPSGHYDVKLSDKKVKHFTHFDTGP